MAWRKTKRYVKAMAWRKTKTTAVGWLDGTDDFRFDVTRPPGVVFSSGSG